MKAILRNCAHGSRIVVAQDRAGAERPACIIKSSTATEGIADLESEWAGYSWYLPLAHPTVKIRRREATRYLSLEIAWIDGTTPPVERGLTANDVAVLASLSHYAEVWAKDGRAGAPRAPMHGDLSLDNVLLTSAGPVFIDWEHFKPEALPVGFDGVYLLFESLWFELKGRAVPSDTALALIRRGLRILEDAGCLHSSFRPAPLERLLELIRANSSLWGAQLRRFEDKLPPLRWSPDQARSIDSKLAP